MDPERPGAAEPGGGRGERRGTDGRAGLGLGLRRGRYRRAKRVRRHGREAPVLGAGLRLGGPTDCEGVPKRPRGGAEAHVLTARPPKRSADCCASIAAVRPSLRTGESAGLEKLPEITESGPARPQTASLRAAAPRSWGARRAEAPPLPEQPCRRLAAPSKTASLLIAARPSAGAAAGRYAIAFSVLSRHRWI